MNTSKPLPPPTSCDSCHQPTVELTTNDKVYGKIFGQWPYVYFCSSCGAAIGCHKNTYTPLGRMADKKTRQLRITAHAAFDPIWQRGDMSRSKAYKWLAKQLGIPPIDCHIALMTTEQLESVVSICRDVSLKAIA